MKKYLSNLISFFGVAFLVFSLSGCAEKNMNTESFNSDDSSVVSDIEKCDFTMGFNEENFNFLCSNISLLDKTVSIPGKLSDWNVSCSFEKIFLSPDELEACFSVMIDDELIGQITYKQNDKIDESKIENLIYNHLVIDGISNNKNIIKVYDFGIGDSIDKVTDTLGIPTKITGNEDTFEHYYYIIDDDNWIGFSVESGKIVKISISKI